MFFLIIYFPLLGYFSLTSFFDWLLRLSLVVPLLSRPFLCLLWDLPITHCTSVPSPRVIYLNASCLYTQQQPNYINITCDTILHLYYTKKLKQPSLIGSRPLTITSHRHHWAYCNTYFLLRMLLTTNMINSSSRFDSFVDHFCHPSVLWLWFSTPSRVNNGTGLGNPESGHSDATPHVKAQIIERVQSLAAGHPAVFNPKSPFSVLRRISVFFRPYV